MSRKKKRRKRAMLVFSVQRRRRVVRMNQAWRLSLGILHYVYVVFYPGCLNTAARYQIIIIDTGWRGCVVYLP